MDPVIKWAFLGVGLFGLGFALMLARRPLQLLRAGGRAEGVVTGNVDQVVSGRTASRTYFFPQVSFTTAKGESVSFQSMSGGAKALAPGTRLRVIYDPKEPHNAIVRAFGVMWFFPMALFLFSLPFLAFGIWGVLRG